MSIADPAVAFLFGYGDPSMPRVSEHTALTLSAVYRAVSLIAGSIASLPLRTLQETSDGQRERVSSFLDRDPTGKGLLTPYEWKELTLVHLVLHGDAFLQHVYNGGGAISGLWPVHPLAVEVELDEGAPGGKLFTVRLDDGTKKTFDGSTMTHIPGLSLDGVRGVSPISLARQSLGTAIAGDKAAGKMFQNGSMIQGLVTPVDDLTEDEAKAVQSSLTGKINLVTHATSAALVTPHLIRHEHGRIVVISSVLTQLGRVDLAGYIAAKSGLEGLVRALARELGGHGVTVNGIRAGSIAVPAEHDVVTDHTAMVTRQLNRQ
jgi:hypothetical protein